MIYTVIAKPTKDCNADCTYCASPPDRAEKWSLDEFKTIFERLAPQLAEEAVIIWHGGEPMLMGPQFYVDAYAYAQTLKPNIKFSMQSNLLLYNKKEWKDVFDNIMEKRLSTSFDPDEQFRTINGSTARYSRQFHKKIKEILRDGYRPLVIGTYTEETAHLANEMYSKSAAYGDKAFDVRFNYRYPAGREAGMGVAIEPKTYGEMLIGLYDRWIKDAPDFSITPLDQMLKKCLGISMGQCPWTRKCGGRFLSIEPNGDAYNCGEFADTENPAYRYGNFKEGWIANGKKESIVGFVRKPKEGTVFIDEIMSSHAAKLMKRRVYDLPVSCTECRHFQECEGGCMRDAELFDRGLGGKFFYCQSWIMVFDRIKESILNGEADRLLINFGEDPEEARRYVTANMDNEMEAM